MSRIIKSLNGTGIFFLGLFLFLFVINILGASAQPVSGEEYKVKAGFIYHFTRFTNWPRGTFKDKNSPINLCIASTNPESDIIFSLNDKTVKDRKIAVRKFRGKKDIRKCQILFIASGDEKFALKKLNTVKDKNILTIGEISGFIKMGGIINFFKKGDRLRFEVNPDAAEKAGIRFSSQLLMSAEIVRKGR